MSLNLAVIGQEAGFAGERTRDSGAGPEDLQGPEWWSLGLGRDGPVGAAA